VGLKVGVVVTVNVLEGVEVEVLVRVAV